MPYLKPSSVLQYLLDTEPWLLLGGLVPGAGSEQLLNTFWNAYRHEHPSHEVFSRGVDLKRTIPLLVHGDGGRTLKKQPLEVVSIQPAVGVDTMKEPCACKCESPTVYSGNDLSDACCLRLNSKHNTYMTHFLVFAFASKKYKKLPGLLNSLLEVTSQDLKQVCTGGLRKQEVTFHFAVLGMKADMEYAAKCGFLSRSYQNVGHRNFIAACHECLAGSLNFPFEDFSKAALWKTTMYQSTPWHVLPPFKEIPFDSGSWTSGRSAMFFKRDTFHIFRLGICRNFIGSSILLLCFDKHFDSPGDSCSIPNRLDRAWSNFFLWMNANNTSVAGIRSFSKEKLHYPQETSFPYVGCKGADSIVLLRWLAWFSSLQLRSHPASVALQKIREAATSGLLMQGMHRHGIFLRPHCREQIARHIRKFLFAYAELAHLCFLQRRTLYAMVPKAHALAHIQHQLELSKHARHSVACNPALYDCSMAEDFIGKVARQSRRVSYRNIEENTILAYKIKTRLVIQRYKQDTRM